VCVDAQVLLINAAASRFVTHDDHHELWHWAQRALDTDDPSVHALPLLGRQLQARCDAISNDGVRSSALIRFVGQGDGARHGRHRPSRPTVGWDSLRESERGIAELVAAGMTNREIGDRLYLSRHTVDAHLRQVFRKLDIRSRVELTRIVVEHSLVADGDTQGAAA
jgi:DNA-binding CsgD family transcriptional regulator